MVSPSGSFMQRSDASCKIGKYNAANLKEKLITIRSIFWIAAPAFMLSAPALGQETEQPAEAEQTSQVPTIAPIIVSGDKSERKDVYTGSRVPTRPRINNDGIASSTGTPGLGPQSGMDPAATVRTIRKRSCKSDDPAIGKRAACIIADAISARDAGDLEEARALFAFVTLSEEFTPQEQVAGARWQYRLAQEEGNDAARDVALQQILATGALDDAETIKVQRALVSLALRDKNAALARERLITLDTMGGADARALANLAVLTRRQNAGDGVAIMRRAIALQTKAGLPSAKGWLDFVDPPQ